MNKFWLESIRNWKDVSVEQMDYLDKVEFACEASALMYAACDGNWEAYDVLLEKFPSAIMEVGHPESIFTMEVPEKYVMFPVTGERDHDLKGVDYLCERCLAEYLFPLEAKAERERMGKEDVEIDTF